MMKFFSANIDNLRKLYDNQLQMLLSAERQIIAALPKMIERSTDTQLKQALQSHLQETEAQATRLEQILREETRSADTIKAKTVAALITEAEDLVRDATDESVRDAAIIAAAQRMEHYEIAAYGAVRTWAHILGKTSHAELLDRTINEEGHADHVLTSISDRVNPAAQKVA